MTKQQFTLHGHLQYVILSSLHLQLKTQELAVFHFVIRLVLMKYSWWEVLQEPHADTCLLHNTARRRIVQRLFPNWVHGLHSLDVWRVGRLLNRVSSMASCWQVCGNYRHGSEITSRATVLSDVAAGNIRLLLVGPTWNGRSSDF